MGHGSFSHEKKGLKAQRLMQLLYVCYAKMIKTPINAIGQLELYPL
jgi:hypothetical protein